MNLRVVFDSGPQDGTAMRLLMDVMSFERRPGLRNPRPWLTGGLTVGTAALAIHSVMHRRGHQVGGAPDRPVQALSVLAIGLGVATGRAPGHSFPRVAHLWTRP